MTHLTERAITRILPAIIGLLVVAHVVQAVCVWATARVHAVLGVIP
jgi:hypothetical protein